jgi:leucine dehydrogenase
MFASPGFDDHEHVSFFAEPAVGLRMIVAIHRTGPLGTAGGGCRMWRYDDDQAALVDALRLSRAMTYKLALLEVPAGGAKAVVLGDPARDKSEALLLAVGRAIDRLNGRFVVGEDVGTGPADLEIVARETRWVSRHAGGADTADATAQGVLVCLRRAVRARLGRERLDGLVVAVQGLGRVGRGLARRLRDEGARLVVADLDPRTVEESVRELGATPEAPERIFDAPVDVFAPCALGGALDRATVPRLRCAVVAGSANNQLAEPRLADELAGRGILYAPDFVVNAGGVLASPDDTERLGPLLDDVLARAARDGVSPNAAAEALARERFRAMGGQP